MVELGFDPQVMAWESLFCGTAIHVRISQREGVTWRLKVALACTWGLKDSFHVIFEGW